MTINIADNSPRANYTATSGQTVFTVSFEFFDEADLTVYINGTETSAYTVTGGDGSTGTVTLTSGATAGDKVAIVRDVAIERTTDFTEGALWYHADYVHPYWADSLNKTSVIDNHIFYK